MTKTASFSPLIVSAAAIVAFSGSSSSFSLSDPATRKVTSRDAPSHTTLRMSGFPQTEEDIPAFTSRIKHHKKRGDTAELSAVAIAASLEQEQEHSNEEISLLLMNPNPTFLRDSVFPVLSTSFLITANTVGASCLVLPELAAGPGFGLFTGVSVLTYLINLVSGLIIAEVAIQQYERSGQEGSSSFKDFADASFDSPLVSNAIAWVSILTNACILVYTFSKAGEVGSQWLGGLDPSTVSVAFVGLVGVGMSCLTRENLSSVASVCVAGLFLSFAGLLLPALTAVQDPIATLISPGVADLPLSSAGQAFPILLLSLVYQNIVPSVAKILNYDRVKTTASLALGSFIPLAMYLAWCFVGLGGGMVEVADVAGSGMGGIAVSAFAMATIAGSSVGTTMSVAEEFDSLFAKDDTSTTPSERKEDVFSVPAVAASMAFPMLAVTAFGGHDMTVALGLAGSIGTPLLYGLVPAVMAYKQRAEAYNDQHALVPGGMASLATLGLASTGMVGQTLLEQVASFAS